MASTFVANDRSYRVPTRPVLAICADGWDPALRRRRARARADAAARRGARRRRHLRARPRPGTDLHQPEQRRDRDRRQRRRATGSPATTTATSTGDEVQVTDPSFLRATHDPRGRARRTGSASLCVTAKDKLRALLAAGGVPGLQRRVRARAGARRRHAAHRGRRRSRTPASTTGGSRRTRSTSRSRSPRGSRPCSSTPR